MNVEAWVCGWDEDGVRQQVDTIKRMYDIPAYGLVRFDHEANVINYALDHCKSEFFWYVESDIDLIHENTLPTMKDWLETNPDVGLIRPHREAEPLAPYLRPINHYIADGTAWLYRISVGAAWDSDFIFTGWGDLDWGYIIESAGYRVQLDPRTSVYKHPTPYGSWSSFRRAFGARNRLLFEAKWYWSLQAESGIVSRYWQGVDYYNQNCDPAKRIPTMFELAGYSTEKLEQFVDSVNFEHPPIQMGKDGTSGNIHWQLPWRR